MRTVRRVRIAAIAFLSLALVTAGVAIVSNWESWTSLRDQARAFEWRLHAGWLAISLAAGVAALLLIARLWAGMLQRTGGRLPPGEAVTAWMGSNLGRYLPGKVWQLAGIAAYSRARGDSAAAALGTSLALQAVLLVVGAALGITALGRAALAGAEPWVLMTAAAAILLALHPAVLRALVRVGARVLGEPPPPMALGAGDLCRAGLGGLLSWLLYGLGFWALIRGLAPGVEIGLPAATGLFAAGYVVGYVVLVAPGGLVVREGAIAALLGSVAGIPLGPAAAIAVAARVWSTVAEVAAFGIAAGAGLRAARGEE